MEKKAFTLAEVLITLLILGIIAAMTLPTLMSKINKRIVEVKLKEDYSILQQALMKANAEVPIYSILPEQQDIAQKALMNWIETYLLSFMKISKICNDTKGCWQPKGPTYDLSGKIAQGNRTNIGVGYSIITAKLQNGTNLSFDFYSLKYMFGLLGLGTRTIWSNDRKMVILIDANGDSPPNVIGKDIYVTIFTEDGLVPAGNDMTKDIIDKNCGQKAKTTDYATRLNNAGWLCLKKVQQNGWQISDDVWNK